MSARADLPLKYALAKAWNDGDDDSFQIRAYLAHIRAFNGFFEDHPRKVGHRDFLISFRNLFESIRAEGLRSDLADEYRADGKPLLGAHRVAICAALEIPIDWADESATGDLWDYQYFRRRGLAERYLDFSAIVRTSIDTSASVFVLHSNTTESDFQRFVELITHQRGKIFHRKNVKLKAREYRNFKRITYWDPFQDNWIGSAKDCFAGAARHAERSSGSNPVKILGVSGLGLESQRWIKNVFRHELGTGNYGCHSTDSWGEACNFSAMCFNARLKHNLATMPDSDMPEEVSFRLSEAFVPTLGSRTLTSPYLIGGGTALSALGLRRTGDIDVFVDKPNVDFSTADLDFHSPEDDRFPVKISRASVDFRYHFVLYGRPFASSRFMFRYKFLRREFPKDFVDIALLSLHFLRFTNLISGEASQNFVAFLIRRRKIWMPAKRFVDSVYLLLVNGKSKVVSICRNFSN